METTSKHDPPPPVRAFSASPSKFLRGETILIADSTAFTDSSSAVWVKIYIELVEHLGGRAVTTKTEYVQMVCVVSTIGASERVLPIFGNIPVVSTDWLDACCKAREKVPWDSFLMKSLSESGQGPSSVGGRIDQELNRVGKQVGSPHKRRKFAIADAGTACNIVDFPKADPTTGTLLVRGIQLSSQFYGAERDRLEVVVGRLKLAPSNGQSPTLVVCKDASASEIKSGVEHVVFVTDWYLCHIHREINRLASGPSIAGGDFGLRASSNEAFNTAARLLPLLLFRPPKSRFGISGMQHFVFCMTGFQDDSIRRYIRRAVKIMGALFLPHLATNLTTHLVCGEINERDPTEKLRRCVETFPDIKIVSLPWLVECLSQWELPGESTSTKEVVRQNDVPVTPYVSQKTNEEVDFYATQFTQMHESTGKPPLITSPTPLLSEKKLIPMPQKRFLLGSFKGSLGEQVAATITTLGGIVVGAKGDTTFVESDYFVLPPEPQKRTEKMLCAIAVR